MADPTYPLFPLFSFLGILFVLAPFPWHLKARNAGTCTYMFWTAIGCLNELVNSISWRGNMNDSAPVWCDISSRLMIASNVAVPAATLSIIRRLHKIATSDVVLDTKAKNRAILEDVSIGFGIPILQMILQLIVNGHRYNILEDIGCFPVTVNVWLAYLLVTAWPLAIGVLSTIYCVLTIRAFHKRDLQLKALLSPDVPARKAPCSSPPYSVPSSAFSSPSSSLSSPPSRLSAITSHRYFRLILLCNVSLVLILSLAIFSLYLNLTSTKIVPYRGWHDLHWGYSRVDRIPAVLWTGALAKNGGGKVAIGIELSRWLNVVFAAVFFAFFGFAEETRKGYERVWFRTINIWRRLRGKENNPYGRRIFDLETVRVRTRPNPIEVAFVHPYNDELCLTPTTLHSEPRLSSETLVNAGEREKRWGPRKLGRSINRGDGSGCVYDGPDQLSLEATMRMMRDSPLQPLKKVLSSPHRYYE